MDSCWLDWSCSARGEGLRPLLDSQCPAPHPPLPNPRRDPPTTPHCLHHQCMPRLSSSAVRRPVVWNLIEKRGRRPSHTFLDYALTYLVSAIFLAFTLGQVSALLHAAVSCYRQP